MFLTFHQFSPILHQFESLVFVTIIYDSCNSEPGLISIFA